MVGGRRPARLALGALAALALALGGCARGGSDNDNHGYGWSYDATGASGLRVRYEESVPEAERADLAVFETAYAEVEACLGSAARGPLVVVVRRGTLDGQSGVNPPPGAHVGGLYYFDTDLVLVTDSLYALRHEFVHYLLDQSGLPVGRNRAHQHDAFADCTGPTWFY
jgi:hypothetical protein